MTDADRWQPVDLSDGRLAAGLADLMRDRWRRLHGGDCHVGWKIAWNDRLTQTRLSLAGCAFGFLTGRTRIATPERVRLDGATLAAVEPELAIHIRVDVAQDATDLEAASAIDLIAPAAEVLDIDGRFDDVSAAIRSNAFHRAFYIAPSPGRYEPGMLDDVSVLAARNGTPASIPVRPADVIGPLANPVRFLAQSLAPWREHLRAGDWILSGMLTPLPIWVRAGEDVSVDFGSLGAISLRFSSTAEVC